MRVAGVMRIMASCAGDGFVNGVREVGDVVRSQFHKVPETIRGVTTHALFTACSRRNARRVGMQRVVPFGELYPHVRTVLVVVALRAIPRDIALGDEVGLSERISVFAAGSVAAFA